MDSENGFHLEEIDGKPYLVYHARKYNPLPQNKSLSSSVEAVPNDNNNNNHLRFVCPEERLRREVDRGMSMVSGFPFESTEYYQNNDYHRPLSPCHQKVHADEYCRACKKEKIGIDHYECGFYLCHRKIHKECAEAPLKLNHPSHPQHPLLLYYYPSTSSKHLNCLCCGEYACYMVYRCPICDIVMHPTCAQKSIPIDIDPPKRHHHRLSFFPRQTSLTCNVCGLLSKLYPTYICVPCNFVAHKDCMNFPSVIKISRHHHRVSHTTSPSTGEWSCGVCRRKIDNNYGAYTCEKCNNYGVHSMCALRKDICDGEELEGVPEEDDLTQDPPPFETIYDGVILHFLHHHQLQLKGFLNYDEKKQCEACVLPIYEGHFYSCKECDFTLHEVCASAPRRIEHALHPHRLSLELADCNNFLVEYRCHCCRRLGSGFVYRCGTKNCQFEIDLRCSLISEPFEFKGHEHPLFLALDLEEKPTCQVCKLECLHGQLNCIKCDFIICFECATLPYKAKYTYDAHFLTLSFGKEVCKADWCEVCERNLGDTITKAFYWCKDCCTTIHVGCLFGLDMNLKIYHTLRMRNNNIRLLPIINVSRPFCCACKNRCGGKLYESNHIIACSYSCAVVLFW